jgi:glycine betaine/proline transport system ATP-binding protein
MDEPFSALDPLIRAEMQELLADLQARLRKTVVFVTHDLDEALKLGDRVAILNDGRIAQAGTPAEILLHPADAYVRAFVKTVNRARVLTVAAVMQPPGPCRARASEAPALSPAAPLADALALVLMSPDPVPVRGPDGEVVGTVSREAIARALSA